MIFLIRDDDVNYFTTPDELKIIYKNIWNKIPINFSITPFLKKGKQDYPIGNNQTLIRFLKNEIEQKKICPALHGFNHRNMFDEYEYWSDFNYKRLFQKTKKGKSYLEKLLNVKITTFVPPHNSINKYGLEAIRKNQLNIINIPPLSSRHKKIFSDAFVVWKEYFYLIYYKNDFPFTLNFKDHKEAAYHSLTPSTNYHKFRKKLNFTYKKRGVFILATHYWELLLYPSLLREFKKNLNYIMNLPDVRFVNYNTLWNIFEN